MVKLVTLYFDKRLFVYLYFGFIAATIAGTVSHEAGHWTAAKMQGINATMHYGSCSYESSGNDVISHYDKYLAQNEGKICKNSLYRKQFHESEIVREMQRFRLFFLLGGPLQTIFTTCISLILLFVFRSRFSKTASLVFWQWALVFGSLFILRQSANLFMLGLDFLMSGKVSLRGDEARISVMLDLPWYSINLASGIAGFLIAAFVVYRFVPVSQRLTFLIAGLLGGISGYVFWLEWFGKYVLP